MHIPDGYLSPSTCAALYGASAPFWYVAFRRLKRALHTQVAPLLSLLSAFSFIVMMFNVPLPGGTTGHAVGVTIAAIVLGPWGAMVSISVALVIQAVLFGDGGITAIGANCFNMAILGSVVAYGVYTLLSGNAPVRSPRRVFAAGAAGYLSINVCALAAAVELGIQPLLFRDAAGTPLYAPYPLHIAIPAMMAGHLTIAGLAELVVSAGVIGYLQRTNPSLLNATATGAAPGISHTRPLWIAVAAMLILTPLGIRVAGSAWGEWTPDDFRKPEVRRQIATASLNAAPPAQAPSGLRRLAGIWTAPLPHYAPPSLPGASAGYLWSAAAGTGLIIFTFSVVSLGFGANRQSYGEKTLASLTSAVEYSGHAEFLAARHRILQRIDPRVKIAGVAAMIAASVASRSLAPILVLLTGATALAQASGIPLRRLALSVWMPALLFSGGIGIPALFLTAGPALHWNARALPVTYTGLRTAIFLISRSETAATLSAMLVLTTQWPHLLKALRAFRTPALAVVMLGMTYRYALSILQTARGMFESGKSRTVGLLTPRDRRRMLAASAGVLLDKSLQMSGEVHQAMLSRGFRGDVQIIDEFNMMYSDWCWLAIFLTIAALTLWTGR